MNAPKNELPRSLGSLLAGLAMFAAIEGGDEGGDSVIEIMLRGCGEPDCEACNPKSAKECGAEVQGTKPASLGEALQRATDAGQPARNESMRDTLDSILPTGRDTFKPKGDPVKEGQAYNEPKAKTPATIAAEAHASVNRNLKRYLDAELRSALIQQANAETGMPSMVENENSDPKFLAARIEHLRGLTRMFIGDTVA